MSGSDSTTVSSLADVPWDPVEERLAVESLQQALFGRARDTVAIGRYRLDQRIALGGMGVVYRAWDPTLSREVAVKLIRPHREDSERAHARLLAEAKAAAGVSHPNVIQVHDCGSFDVAEVFGAGEGQGVFMVMEFVDGPTLDGWLDEARSWREVLVPFLGAGDGLAAVHRAGLVHRDFKPANVLMGEPVRIADFGLATSSEFEGDAQEVAGTPAYMAPEQREGRHGPKSDQFAFCAALWRGLYGSAPRREEGGGVELRAPPNSKVPRWLHAAVCQGLETDPERRHASMDALLSRLRAHAGRRRRRALVAAGVVTASAAAVVGFQVGRPRDPRCEDPPLQGQWSPRLKADIRERFEASGLPFAARAFTDFEEHVDRYADAWDVARQRACEMDAGPQQQRVFSCLRREELRALGLIEIYTEPDALLIERVSASADRLGSPARCTPAEVETVVAEPSAELERADLLFELGRNAQAWRSLARVEADAGDLVVQARVAALRCRLTLDEERDAEESVRVCTNAWRAAERAQLQPIAANMVLLLAELRHGRGETEDAWRLLELAEAKIAALEEPTARRIFAQHVRASLLADRDPEAAAALIAEIVGEAERFYGTASTNATPYVFDLARAYESLGRREEARALYEAVAVRIRERSGEQHPHLAAVYNNLGLLAQADGDYARAEDHWSKALALKLATPGWDVRRTASTRANLARLHAQAGRWDQAVTLANEALEADPDSLFVLSVTLRVLRSSGRLAELERVARARDAERRAREAPVGEAAEAVAIEIDLALANTDRSAAMERIERLLEDLPSAPRDRDSRLEATLALAIVSATLGDAEAALEAERAATAVYEADPVDPLGWASWRLASIDAFGAVAPERARAMAEEAEASLRRYAPEHPWLATR